VFTYLEDLFRRIVSLSEAVSTNLPNDLYRQDLTYVSDGAKHMLDVVNRLPDPRKDSEKPLYRFAHDLRSPTNSVLGFARMLLTHPQLYGNEVLPADQAATVQQICLLGNQILISIDEWMDFSRIVLKKVEVMRDVLDLHIVLNDVEATFRRGYDQVPLRIDLPETSGLPPVYGDETLTEQLLSGLCSAVFRQMPGVDMTLTARYSGQTPPQCEIVLTCRPALTGPERLLDVEAAIAENTLGFHNAQALAALQGGALRFSSDSGAATEIVVTLPVAEAS